MPHLLWGMARVVCILAAFFILSFTLSAHAAPTVSLTSPANGATFTTPASLTLTAEAADGDSSITSVAFYQGSTLLGTVSTAPYNLTWNGVTAGNYALTAVATNALGATTTSGTVNISVTASGANSNGPITYIYDELDRLVGVSDATGASATYTYDAVGNIVSIARTTGSQAAISEFTPNGGPAGTTVTIYGSGFSTTASQNVVAFNGMTATVTSSTATQLVTTVPAGATTGAISVSTPAGTATSTAPFTVSLSQAPTIASFTPTIGVAGTAVTITGTNFETVISNNKVEINTRAATLNSGSASELVAAVPQGGTSGKISVTTPYGTAVSNADFFVAPSPYTVADIQVTDRMTIGQSKTVTITAAGKKGLILFDGVGGQRISLTMSAVTMSIYSTVTIRNPDGTTLASASVSNSGFIDVKTLPATGTYTIVIDPYSTSTGNATLRLYDVPPDAAGTISPGGSAVTVAATVPGQNPTLTFSGTAGQQVTVRVTGNAVGAVKVSLLNAGGTTVTSTTSGIASFNLSTQTLSTTGTYSIAIDPTGSNTGDISIGITSP